MIFFLIIMALPAKLSPLRKAEREARNAFGRVTGESSTTRATRNAGYQAKGLWQTASNNVVTQLQKAGIGRPPLSQRVINSLQKTFRQTETKLNALSTKGKDALSPIGGVQKPNRRSKDKENSPIQPVIQPVRLTAAQNANIADIATRTAATKASLKQAKQATQAKQAADRVATRATIKAKYNL